jgi:protein involved in polysaccharide export with SLBB domain
MLKQVIVLLILLLSIIGTVYAQEEVNPKTLDVEKLSDPQIRKFLAEVEKRGLSEQEAMTLATAYGLSPTQIEQIKKRIQDLDAQKDDSFGRESEYDDEEFFAGLDSMKYSQKRDFPEEEEAWKKVFGFQLFNSKNLTFEPGINLAVPPTYVLGPGDEIVIDIYGASQQQYTLSIDKNGSITIPNVGPVALDGLELSMAEKRIFNKLTLIYRDLAASQPRTFANIQMGAIKAIKVNVIGEVYAPGTYTLPGTATAFNAIYLSGGPNFNGSFRTIKIIRQGQEIAELDVYDYLINGNSSINAPLRDGDVILVPTYNKRIRMGGTFIRTGIFEGKEGETIADMVKYAGGFNEQAYTYRLELYRNNGREWVMKDLPQEAYAKTAVQSGDSLFSDTILTRFANRVSIDGAVFRPGNYELTEGLTLKELIERADGVREDAFLERGLILRLNEDLSFSNLSFNVSEVMGSRQIVPLRREDAVMISPIDSMREFRTVDVIGEVLKPGKLISAIR